MRLLSFLRKSPTPETECANTLIELIYSGRDMAAHLVMQDGRDFSCVCGMITGPVENPAHHHNFCPVARFYAAVEAVRLPTQVPAPTSRYSTPREDAALFAVLGAITVALVLAVLHFAQKAGLPW
jgi:hypothetical protein